MKRFILAAAALALAIPLAACGGAPAPTAPGAIAPPADAPPTAPAPETAAVGPAPTMSTRLARLEQRYRDVRAFVDLLLPFAPAAQQAQVAAIAARIDLAFAAARTAATAADQIRRLVEAEQAIAELAAAR